MTIHLVRDYLTQNITTVNRAWIPSYLLTIFMRRVLLYTYVGDTNYPINTVGTLLIATADTTPTQAVPTFAAGTRAGINLGSQKEFWVSIPSSVRVVSAADVGRLLVLRSTANPTFNSGIFLIVGFDTSTNAYIIDYRTLGDKPPVEAADSMNWYLYEKDLNCPINGASNTKGAGFYQSDGNSATPRIMLQSPHALAFQIRVCCESNHDWNGGLSFGGQGTGNCAQQTVAPGFGGTVAGDFPAGGNHFHAPMWFNSDSLIYQGGAPGYGDDSTTPSNQMRITIIGDDTGQSVTMFCRRPGNATNPKATITCFGLPDNEPTPLPVNNTSRLFVVGSGQSTSPGNSFGNFTNDGSLLYSNIGTGSGCQGMTMSTFGVPMAISPSMWAYVTGGGQGSSITFDGAGQDNPFISATELLPIDLVEGTLNSWTGGTAVWPLSTRTIGTIPFIRSGRSNFGDFSPTTDLAKAWQHMRRGIYFPWGGPNFTP
jgi:hypothetical protein